MKSFLTYLALVGFTTVSAVSVVRAVRTELRRPPPFDAASLGAWLAAPTREDDTPTTLRRAARRLEQEFHDGFNRRPEYDALADESRRSYEVNWKRLLLTLVRQHADAYAAAPEHARAAFIDERRAQFFTWYAFESGRKVTAFELFRELSNDRDVASIRLTPQEVRRIEEFAAVMQPGGELLKWFRGFLPTGLVRPSPSPSPARHDR